MCRLKTALPEKASAFMKAQIKEAKRLRDLGHSNAQIAKKVGLSPKTVVKYLGKAPESVSSRNRKSAQVARHTRIRQQKAMLCMPSQMVVMIEGAQKDSKALVRLDKKITGIVMNGTELSAANRRIEKKLDDINK